MINEITRKRLIKISLVGLGLLILLFLYNNSLLTIRATSNEDKVVYIKKGDSTENFNLREGSKTLFLPRGSYEIEVVGQEKISHYQKSLGFFWKHNIDVELKQQNSSVFLGSSPLGCAREIGNKSLFYSCNPGNFGLVSSKGGTSANNTDDTDKLSTLTSVLKPYKKGFVEASAEEGLLKIQLVNSNGARGRINSIQNFWGEATESSFAIEANGKMAIFDSSSASLLLFKEAMDPSPVKVDLKDIEIDRLEKVLTVVLTESHAFLVNAPNGEDLDNHEGGEDTEHQDIGPKIITVNNSGEHEVTEEELPTDWIVLSSYGGPAASVLLSLTGNQQGQVFKYSAEEGLELVTALKDTIQTICWKDSNTFYYRADASKSIFEYSFEKAASYLVYSLSENFIEEISCLNGDLYFSIYNENKLNPDHLFHYKLISQPFSGVRLNTILPLYHTFNGDTLRIEESRGGITIDLDYDSQGNGPPAKNTARQEILKILADNGVVADNLEVTFDY